jgi:hypothetical protein
MTPPPPIRNVVAEVIFVIAVLLVIVSGAVLAVWRNNPACLARAGAAVAALAAGAVLFQIRTELKIEEERSVLTEQLHKFDAAEATTPIERLEARLQHKRVEHLQSDLAHARLRVAIYVVSAAMLGEILHGFGDPIMCWFVVCPAPN